jgi:hypothetical protein
MHYVVTNPGLAASTFLALVAIAILTLFLLHRRSTRREPQVATSLERFIQQISWMPNPVVEIWMSHTQHRLNPTERSGPAHYQVIAYLDAIGKHSGSGVTVTYRQKCCVCNILVDASIQDSRALIQERLAQTLEVRSALREATTALSKYQPTIRHG